jgi:hypothetical protein
MTPRVPPNGKLSAHSAQLEPAALIAEINMLLEFVSGRSDRTLGGGQQFRFPDNRTYDQALTQFFTIRQKVAEASERSQESPRSASGVETDSAASGEVSAAPSDIPQPG